MSKKKEEIKEKSLCRAVHTNMEIRKYLAEKVLDDMCKVFEEANIVGIFTVLSLNPLNTPPTVRRIITVREYFKLFGYTNFDKFDDFLVSAIFKDTSLRTVKIKVKTTKIDLENDDTLMRWTIELVEVPPTDDLEGDTLSTVEIKGGK